MSVGEQFRVERPRPRRKAGKLLTFLVATCRHLLRNHVPISGDPHVIRPFHLKGEGVWGFFKGYRSLQNGPVSDVMDMFERRKCKTLDWPDAAEMGRALIVLIVRLCLRPC